MGCPECDGKDWVIVGGGNGLLEGWGRWRCECGYMGIATFQEMNVRMGMKKDRERKERIRHQEQERNKYSRDKYKNTFAKKFKRR